MIKGLRSKSIYAELLDRTNLSASFSEALENISWCLLSRVSCHQASFLICGLLTPSYAIKQWAYKNNSNCHIKLLKGWLKQAIAPWGDFGLTRKQLFGTSKWLRSTSTYAELLGKVETCEYFFWGDLIRKTHIFKSIAHLYNCHW